MSLGCSLSQISLENKLLQQSNCFRPWLTFVTTYVLRNTQIFEKYDGR